MKSRDRRGWGRGEGERDAFELEKDSGQSQDLVQVRVQRSRLECAGVSRQVEGACGNRRRDLVPRPDDFCCS